MSYMINHIHIKTDDPDKVAEWYVEAFGFEIISRRVRDFNPKLMDYFILLNPRMEQELISLVLDQTKHYRKLVQVYMRGLNILV